MVLVESADIAVAAGVVATAAIVGLIGRHLLIKREIVGEGVASLTAILAIIGISVAGIASFAPQTAESLQLITPPELTPATVGPGELVVIQSDKEGYVLVSAVDDYKRPLDMLSGATIYVSLEQPVGDDVWIPIAEDNTSTIGATSVTVPGITEGTVYVSGGLTGYYPDVTTVTVTGAQTFAPQNTAGLELPQIGALSWSLIENTNGYTQGTENIVDNLTTSTSARYTIRFVCDNGYMAIQDLRILLVRGGAWDTIGASVTAIPVDDGDTLAIESGDLVEDHTAELLFSGDLVFGQQIEVRIVIAADTAAAGTIATLIIDDLNGDFDVLGGTGISEQTITLIAEV